MKNIIIFGGSFDPITKGHEYIINAIKHKYPEDEIWLFPCMSHYFDKVMTSSADRIKMCQIIAKKHNIKAYLDTLKTFHAGVAYRNYSEDNFKYIIGMDNANNISSWYKGDVLPSIATFIVIPRGGYKTNKKSWYTSPPHSILDVCPLKISSTEVREAIKNKKSLDKLVDKEIINYINTHNLYINAYHLYGEYNG